MKRGTSKVPTALHRPLGKTCHSNEKANGNANFCENQLTFHDLYDQNHERQMETRIRALLASADGTLLGKN